MAEQHDRGDRGDEQSQTHDDLGAVGGDDRNDALLLRGRDCGRSGLRSHLGGLGQTRIDLVEIGGLSTHLTVEEEGIDADRQHDDRDLLPRLVAAIRADECRQGEGEGGRGR